MKNKSTITDCFGNTIQVVDSETLKFQKEFHMNGQAVISGNFVESKSITIKDYMNDLKSKMKTYESQKSNK